MAKSFNPSKYAALVQTGPTVLSNPHSSTTVGFFGALAVSTTTLVVSATGVKSDSLVFLSPRAINGLATYNVASIFAGGFTVQGSFIVAGSGTLYYEVKNIK